MTGDFLSANRSLFYSLVAFISVHGVEPTQKMDLKASWAFQKVRQLEALLWIMVKSMMAQMITGSSVYQSLATELQQLDLVVAGTPILLQELDAGKVKA